MNLNETERLTIRVWELEQQQLVRTYEQHNAALPPVLRRVERRLKLPAGAIGTTHELRDWSVVPMPDVEETP